MIEPTVNAKKPCEIVCFSNSNYAGNLVSRRSICGFIIYVLGVPVSWQSKSQKSVSLSSSKAEYVALSEANKVVFILQMLRSMMILIKLPVTVRVDYVDAIVMASNIATTSYTKHMDIRHKYVYEYVEE